jgi:NAD(P)H-nitrite reductase large subunit
MEMGVKLEKMLFGMWSPHKVKLAVSGCPRNCAEAGIKDVGVIGVDPATKSTSPATAASRPRSRSSCAR